MRTRTSLGIVAIAWATAMPAAGQERPSDVTQMVEQAWSRASAARQAEGRVNEADAGRAQASSPFAGSPSLSLATRNDKLARDHGVEEHDVSVAAPIWLPSQRSARGALAEAEVGEAQARVQAARLMLAGEVRERIWALAAAESDLEHAQIHAEATQRLEADVMRRVNAGDLAYVEGLLAKQERLIAMAAVQAARSKHAEAASKLQALTGYAQFPARYEEAIHNDSPSLEAHPRVLAARLGSDRAAKRIRYVSSTRRDAPEVAVSYRWERGVSDSAYDQTVGVGIRIPLATAARNAPLDAAALTEASTAAAEERATLDGVQADIAAAQAALESAEQNLLLTEERNATASERTTLLKKAFDAGELGLAEWLRAQGTARGAEVALEHARTEHGLARARLNQARGVLP